MARESVYFTVDKGVGLYDTALLERALDSMPGVASVSINKAQCRIAVDFDSTSASKNDIQAKIEILGYPIERA